MKATDLDNAWKNLDPELPLPGDTHPFYVPRPGEPMGRLIQALRLAAGREPKFFFSGYRGSGKSTELNRVANNYSVGTNYWVVPFSVKDTGDIQNLDYRDVLLALGAQVYAQYVSLGGNLDRDLLDDLERWKGSTVERLRSKGAVFETGAGFDLSQFFLATLLKIKTEHETRELIRQEIGPRINELIEKINRITENIERQVRKPVLVLIDDLDKLRLENARAVFQDNLSALTLPKCGIVFTIPAVILYEDAFMTATLFQDTYFLPNIRLHPHLNRALRPANAGQEPTDPEGYTFFEQLIERRMDPDLITKGAMQALIGLSGGVPSDLVFAVQAAISNALHRNSTQVAAEDITWAYSQLRNPLMRLLGDADLQVLREIYLQNPNRLPNPSVHSRLIHIRAVLQYANDEDWYDTHPALSSVLSR